jgi:hypothetical protein
LQAKILISLASGEYAVIELHVRSAAAQFMHFESLGSLVGDINTFAILLGVRNTRHSIPVYTGSRVIVAPPSTSLSPP